MSRKLLSHVSLSSLPRRLKSPRDEVNSKSTSGTTTSGLLQSAASDRSGWSKSSNPLEKLMQQATDPIESGKGEGAADSQQPLPTVLERQRSGSGDSLEGGEKAEHTEKAAKNDGGDKGREEEEAFEATGLPTLETTKPLAEKRGGRDDERAKEARPTKRSSSKRRKKHSSNTDLITSAGGSMDPHKPRRSRKTRKHVPAGGGKEERKRLSGNRTSSRRSERPNIDELSSVPSPLPSPQTSPQSSPHRVKRESSAPSTRSSETSEADEVLERTLRLVRSLSSYKFKRGASMDDILQDISSDGESSLGRSRREETNISSSMSAGSVRVTKNMTTLANKVTLGKAEATPESPKRGRTSKKDRSRREKDDRAARRPSLSVSSLDLDEEEEERPNKGRKRKLKGSKGSPSSSPRRAAMANSLSTPNAKEGDGTTKRRSASREKGGDTPLFKRLSSAFTRATKKTSDVAEDPDEMEKFYQQKLKATVEVLESVHAAEMMAKRMYRQLQREERELLKKCEQLSHSRTFSRSGGGRSSECETPVGMRFNILTSDIGVCEQIGSGASGTIVYRCIVDGWACAVKELTASPGMFYCDEERDAFEKEMAYLCQLPPHPNIVQYLFHTKMNKQYCLFMALYDGTLRQHIDACAANSKGFDVVNCTQIALKIAEGLAFLHDQQVLHRDIKVSLSLPLSLPLSLSPPSSPV